MDESVLQAVRFLEKKNSILPSVGIVLGSGLGSFTESLSIECAIPYKEIPNFPQSSVPGHEGVLVVGHVNKVSVYVLKGRVHYYEGKTLQEVTFPIRVFKKMGINTIIFTNAAGILNLNYKPGEFMLIRDHLNFLGENPLRGKNWDEWGPRFPNLLNAYDENLRRLAKQIAEKVSFPLQEGIYAAISGPTYETPAEARMLQILGADVVGMSTVPEVIVARHQGTRVCGFSCLTNYAADLSHQKGHEDVTHEEVLDTTRKVSGRFSHFLQTFIGAIPHEQTSINSKGY